MLQAWMTARRSSSPKDAGTASTQSDGLSWFLV